MNDELAYLFGLIIGGGTLTPGGIDIEFPYKQWLRRDLQITPLLYTSAIQNVTPLIHSELGAWAIPRCIPGRTPRFHIEVTNVPNIFFELLRTYGIRPIGELRKHASIETMLSHMNTGNKRRFISGLADVIGSVSVSHRHRSLHSTIVSFEFLGDNWNLPFEVCQTLHELKVPVDQILWHHPNMHAGTSRTAEWRKGFKVRVKAGDFSRVGFGFDCKIRGLRRLLNIERRHRGHISHNRLCPNQRYRIKGIKLRHQDENSDELPCRVRGHAIHYTHICAALGCPHAPRAWLRRMVPQYTPQGATPLPV
jgi:hypothetical protein